MGWSVLGAFAKAFLPSLLFFFLDFSEKVWQRAKTPLQVSDGKVALFLNRRTILGPHIVCALRWTPLPFETLAWSFRLARAPNCRNDQLPPDPVRCGGLL